MNCEEALSLVERLADGECTAEEKAGAEAHVDGCPNCREHLRFLTALSGASRGALLPEPPEAYWDMLPRKIMARLETEAVPRARGKAFFGLALTARLHWVGALAAAAVVTLVVGAGVLLPRLGQERAGPRDTTQSRLSEEAAAVEGRIESPEEAAPVPLREEPEQKQARHEDEGVRGPSASSSEEVRPELQAAPSIEPPGEAPPAKTLPSGGFGAARARVVQEGLLSKRLGAPRAEKETLAKVPSVAELDSVGEAEELREDQRTAAVGGAAPASVSIPVREKVLVRSAAVSPAEAAREDAPAPTVAFKTQTTPPGEADARDAFRALREKHRSAETMAGRVQAQTEDRDPKRTEAECRDWRDFVARYPSSEQALDARYRLALCSIRLFDQRRTEPARRQALEDAAGFLEQAPPGERAETVRRERERLRRK